MFKTTEDDINNMILAENDYIKFKEWQQEKARTHDSIYRHCQITASLLSIIAKDNGEFNQIGDINNNKIITYTMNNIIYLPACVEIDAIFLKNNNNCYKDQPIDFTYKNVNRSGFLTTNNIIKDNSKMIDCDQILSNQLLPSLKQILVRNGKESAIHNGEHIIIHDIASSTHSHENLTFDHHIEIFSNYDTHNIVREFSKEDDIDGKFYSLQNDED
jgi:hypothetical protein